MKLFFTLFIEKSVKLLLKLFHRNGSYLPGEIALKLDKDFLAHIEKPETFIAITGTNGKTTTSNLVTSILRANGYEVTNNSLGSNVEAGVVACFADNSTLTGKPKHRIAVIEVDERSSLRVYGKMAPDILLVNNIMRDSIKRNANTDFISYIISSALPDTTKLILNGDDGICSNIAPQCRNRIYFGVDANPPETAPGNDPIDFVYCPECGGHLDWEYRRFNHIGKCRCGKCGWTLPEKSYNITAFDVDKAEFTISHNGEENTYSLINDNIVNIYNSAGAVAVLTEAGLSTDEIKKGFSASGVVKTRLESYSKGNTEVIFLLAKGQNPCACERCFSYTANEPGEKKAVLMLVDDHNDNINNTENPTWFYTLDYSPLVNDSIATIGFGGARHADHVMRCAMTGIPDEKIVATADYKGLASMINPADYDKIYILFHNYCLEERDYVGKEILNTLSE